MPPKPTILPGQTPHFPGWHSRGAAQMPRRTPHFANNGWRRCWRVLWAICRTLDIESLDLVIWQVTSWQNASILKHISISESRRTLCIRDKVWQPRILRTSTTRRRKPGVEQYRSRIGPVIFSIPFFPFSTNNLPTIARCRSTSDHAGLYCH